MEHRGGTTITGTIARLMRDGYGFVTPDDAPGTHVFFSHRDAQVNFDFDLFVGQRVTFARGVDARSGRPQAKTVRPIDATSSSSSIR